jgi:2,4-dienoyl-CoA reductase-like NADH-dependent reductase (Old Yellow Enzyme family)
MSIISKYLFHSGKLMEPLAEPLALKSFTIHNQTLISPMCQYSAKEGLAND